MTDKPIRIPGPDHPITIAKAPGRVIVRLGGKVIADTRRALSLREASYFSLPLGGEKSRNAVWSYEKPYEAVSEIKDYLAFYPDRVDAIEEIAAG